MAPLSSRPPVGSVRSARLVERPAAALGERHHLGLSLRADPCRPEPRRGGEQQLDRRRVVDEREHLEQRLALRRTIAVPGAQIAAHLLGHAAPTERRDDGEHALVCDGRADGVREVGRAQRGVGTLQRGLHETCPRDGLPPKHLLRLWRHLGGELRVAREEGLEDRESQRLPVAWVQPAPVGAHERRARRRLRLVRGGKPPANDRLGDGLAAVEPADGRWREPRRTGRLAEQRLRLGQQLTTVDEAVERLTQEVQSVEHGGAGDVSLLARKRRADGLSSPADSRACQPLRGLGSYVL